MLTTVTVKLTTREVEILEQLRGGFYNNSRSDVLRQALLAMARKRHMLSAPEVEGVCADREREHRSRRRRGGCIAQKRKGNQS